jgi:hypothetical protein
MELVGFRSCPLSSLLSLKSNSDTIQLAALAAECSEAVYKRRQTQTPEPVTAVVDVGEFAASVDGSIRATLIKTDETSKTIVLSFRGTKATSPIDWLTNANGDAEDASEVSYLNTKLVKAQVRCC